jgi:hypothetical protein
MGIYYNEPNNGTILATDTVSGEEYQILKLAIGGTGTATLLPGDSQGVDAHVTTLPEAQDDAFGRLRVSSPKNLFDSQLTYDLQPLLWEQMTNSANVSITHDSTNRCALMTFTSATNGAQAYMQTYEHFRYTAGKSQLAVITFNMNGGVADTTKFAGYSDGTNGIEFQFSGTNAQLVLLSASTHGNTTVAQADWSVDKLNGSGASGLTLSGTNTQILWIDLQALYVGRVRAGFNIGGKYILAHEFKHANVATHPYIQTANLPLRCGMTCTGGTVSTTMNYICSTVISEGGEVDSEGLQFSYDGTVTAASGSRTHLLSLQPKTTFNSIANRSKFILEGLELAVTGNNPVQWELCIGDVLTGTTSFNDVNTTYSAIQYNTAGTTSGSPAIVVASGYAMSAASTKGAQRTSVTFKYPITLNAAGAARDLGRLTLLVTGIGGTSACRGILNWKEIR